MQGQDSPHRLRAAVGFFVQEGIDAWDDTRRLVDARFQTVSVIGSQLKHVVPILWTTIGSRAHAEGRVYRAFIGGLPEMVTRTLRRRLLADIDVKLPGFSNPTIHWTETHYYIVSEVTDSSKVDASGLTFRPYVALIETDTDCSADQICEQLRDGPNDFRNSGLLRVLAAPHTRAVFRVMSLETHSVLQIFSRPGRAVATVKLLTDRKLHQVRDEADIPTFISQLRQ